MNALVPVTNAEVYRASTDAASLCREIVMKTAMTIQKRQYVKVEGWQAIAVAHGCVASAEDVRRVNDEGMGGFSAIGVIRRMSDGAEIARAEGFLGDDETMWANRPVYARRAMVQTRAISRACRSAFAHVVVLIDANLSTTPAEEVPDGGFDDRPTPRNITPDHEPARAPANGGRKSSPAVIAAKNAILETPSEHLGTWIEENEAGLKSLSTEDYKEIVDFLNATMGPKQPAKADARADEVFV